MLASVRAACAARTWPCSPEPPRRRPADAAVVIDDAHLSADAELDSLAELWQDRGHGVVAAEPLAHSPALRALATAMEREKPAVALGPWPRAEVIVPRQPLGAAPHPSRHGH